MNILSFNNHEIKIFFKLNLHIYCIYCIGVFKLNFRLFYVSASSSTFIATIVTIPIMIVASSLVFCFLVGQLKQKWYLFFNIDELCSNYKNVSVNVILCEYLFQEKQRQDDGLS